MADDDKKAFDKWLRKRDIPDHGVQRLRMFAVWRAAIAYASSWKLPCDVRLPPATTIRRGCSMSTLITAIQQRKKFPEDARVFPDRPTIDQDAASAFVFRNDGHDLPDTSDLDCPHCGGSGHKDDVRPLSPIALDDAAIEAAIQAAIKAFYTAPHDAPAQDTFVRAAVTAYLDALPAANDSKAADASAQPEPPADLVERAHVALAGKYPLTVASSPEMYRFVAAFAAEYAADWKRKAGVAEDAYFAVVGRREEYLERAETAEKDRDALLSALGFKPGPITDDRRVILRDAEGLRPAMLRARREAEEAMGDALLWRMLLADGHANGLLAAAWKQRIEWKKRAAAAEQALAEEREARQSIREKGERIEREANAFHDVGASLEAKIRIKVCDEIAAAIRDRKGEADVT